MALAGGFRRLRDLFGMLGKKFNGFAAERFNTVAPICCGPYAVRVRLAPAGNPPPATRSKDIVADMRERLADRQPLLWTLELQFFVDEATTPIEDASVAWPDAETPIVTVARLVLPQQGVDAAAAEAEAARFDPVGGLAAHRPLGEVMRARKVAYFESQKGRTQPDQARSSTSLRSFRPARKRARLSRKISKIASFWPSEWLAVCGETSTLGMSHSGDAGSSGSRSNTSR